MPKLLLATNNRGKVREFQALLGGTGVELLLPEEIGLELLVLEEGQTYAENAARKALAFARAVDGLPWAMTPAWKWTRWMANLAYILTASTPGRMPPTPTGASISCGACRAGLVPGRRAFALRWRSLRQPAR